MKYLCLLSALLLAGCGAKSSMSNPTLPPVSAQTNYSTASLIGTYSVNLVAAVNGYLFTDIGTMTLDGNGKITGGSLTVWGGSIPCTASLSGTYSVNSDASGVAMLNITGNPSGCAGASPLQFSLQASQQGETVMFAEQTTYGYSNAQQAISGTAVKQ